MDVIIGAGGTGKTTAITQTSLESAANNMYSITTDMISQRKREERVSPNLLRRLQSALIQTVEASKMDATHSLSVSEREYLIDTYRQIEDYIDTPIGDMLLQLLRDEARYLKKYIAEFNNSTKVTRLLPYSRKSGASPTLAELLEMSDILTRKQRGMDAPTPSSDIVSEVVELFDESNADEKQDILNTVNRTITAVNAVESQPKKKIAANYSKTGDPTATDMDARDVDSDLAKKLATVVHAPVTTKIG